MKPVFYLWCVVLLLFALLVCWGQTTPPVNRAVEGSLNAASATASRSALAAKAGPLSECYFEEIDANSLTQLNKTTIPLYTRRNLARKGEAYAFVDEVKGDVMIHVNWSGLKPHKSTMRIVVNVPVQ